MAERKHFSFGEDCPPRLNGGRRGYHEGLVKPGMGQGDAYYRAYRTQQGGACALSEHTEEVTCGFPSGTSTSPADTMCLKTSEAGRVKTGTWTLGNSSVGKGARPGLSRGGAHPRKEEKRKVQGSSDHIRGLHLSPAQSPCVKLGGESWA